MKYFDSSNCSIIKPALAKVLMEETVVRAVFTVREEPHIARHALILFGYGVEPLVATSEVDYQKRRKAPAFRRGDIRRAA